MVCDSVLMEELKEALAAWRPWAADLLEPYLNGQKRACTTAAASCFAATPSEHIDTPAQPQTQAMGAARRGETPVMRASAVPDRRPGLGKSCRIEPQIETRKTVGPLPNAKDQHVFAHKAERPH